MKHEPIHTSDANFEKDVINSELPVLVDFWAPWCGPCRMVAPVLEELANEFHGRAVIAKLNTDESPHISAALGIRSIPTLVIFKGGKPVDGVVGAVPKKTLAQLLDKHIAEVSAEAAR